MVSDSLVEINQTNNFALNVGCDFYVLVQWLSHVQFFVTPWTVAHQASLSFTISWSLLKLMPIELVMPSNHLILCWGSISSSSASYLILLHLCSIFPIFRVFSGELDIHFSWIKYWAFGFSISPSNEYSGLISLSIDWFDLLAFQGTLESLLQHHNL